MFDILTLIPGKKTLSQSGWHSFNALCCQFRGHRADTRKRGGIRLGENSWQYHCFNCGFKCGFFLGKSITKNTRLLLQWLHIDENQINRWNLESLQHRDLLEIYRVRKERKRVKFNEFVLEGGELLDINNSKHKVYIEYLRSRGLNHDAYPFLVTPELEGRQSNRIIIPFTFEGKIVGQTSRFLDDRKPKFINEQQAGYVFGYDLQKPESEVCILCEGIFDAISIDGCALTHNTINDDQVEVLSRLNKRIIFVPDLDKTGLATCDRALELGYEVSIPEWDQGIKDINEAVVKYGKFPTLLSILQSATTSKIIIEMRRKSVAKRL
jgi:hypothetical protein